MKVLIVEDDPLLVDVVCAKLKRDGYEVFAAYNGEEGLFKLKECLPSIVILDISMPIMDGFEFLKIIKSDNNFKDIPVIMFSSSEEDDNVERGKSLGASAFLVKSRLSLEDIRQKIEEVLKDK